MARVLVVDDERKVLESSAALLAACGHTVHRVLAMLRESRSAGCDYLHRKPFDLAMAARHWQAQGAC